MRPSLLLGNVGREAGVKEGRGERERGREEGAGRTKGRREPVRGRRAGWVGVVMAGNPEEAREREPNEVAPREAGEQARDRG